MTPQKLTFQEVRNNFFHLLIFVFIGLFFACGQKKVENKAVDNQRDTLKVSTKKDITLNGKWKSYLDIDSVISYLNKNTHIKDTTWENNCGKIAMKDYFHQGISIAFLQPNVGFGNLESEYTYPSMLYVLQKENQKWKVIDNILPIYDNNTEYNYYLDTIKTGDFNFDKQPDVYIRYSVKHVSRVISIFYFLTFDKEQKKPKYKQYIYSTDSIAILPKTKNIITWVDGGNFGRHEKNIYQWNSDTLQEIKKIERTIAMNKDGGILGYEMIEYVLQNNKLVKKREWLDKNESDYFEKWQ